jgi:anti-sigma regulatory factor (Ser/Thr protein kinase)
MKLRGLLAVVFAFGVAANGQIRDGRLEGCPNVTTIGVALENVQHSRWQDLTVKRVQSMWPTELLGASCDSVACSSIESKGRIIDGRYVCSEAFQFDVKRDGESAVERLNNIVIHYSASDKKSTTDAIKIMARAIGLSDRDLQRISGEESQRDFHWDSAQGELSTLFVEFSHKGTVWTGTLRLSHFPK